MFRLVLDLKYQDKNRKWARPAGRLVQLGG